MSRVGAILPDWLAGPWRDKERSLLAMERKLQRRFLTEYRSQVKGLEPVLRERGNLIGMAIIDAFVGQRATDVSYADTASATATFFKQPQMKEILQTIDPLISPVLDPFVEGLRSPIDAALSGIERDVKTLIVGTAAVSLVTGIVIGSLIAKKGKDR